MSANGIVGNSFAQLDKSTKTMHESRIHVLIVMAKKDLINYLKAELSAERLIKSGQTSWVKNIYAYFGL